MSPRLHETLEAVCWGLALLLIAAACAGAALAVVIFVLDHFLNEIFDGLGGLIRAVRVQEG